MELKDIYKIEKFTQDELDNVNLLIENGWALLQIGTSDYRYDRLGYIAASETLFFVGADKSTFRTFNLELHRRNLNIESSARSLARRLENAERYRQDTIRINKILNPPEKNHSGNSSSYVSVGNNHMEISDDDLPF
ncbi:hypothetical protein [Lactococcus sp. DD01]|uniref:hypothetical protein n=1 Tax=Lactococcus sp. DD01 TaxID=1776443 RepID=UPI00077622CA|nr:hypothetical protein [Lactococcus sp. DD01]KXT63193.1 hypothetical protein LACDD01_00137 [Lactococcus sp. DD01]